jgi:hypothetical protein
MSDIDLAVTRSQRLEQTLERDFGASGRGLHEKVSSVADALPKDLVRRLRLVATVRNKVVHENGRIDDRNRFLTAADSAERDLATIVKRRGRGRRGKGRLIFFLAMILLIVAVAAKLWW